MRILVAEDDPINQIYIKNLLKKKGFSVEIASNGEKAIETWRREGDFDLILMDVQMPGVDGIEATREIRRQEKENKIERVPIIAVTAYGEGKEREKMLSSGVTDFITKPIDLPRLLALISELENDDYSDQEYKKVLLADFKGTEDTLTKMLELGLWEIPNRLSEIEKGIETKDPSLTADSCHSLANVVGILRAEQLRDEIISMEHLIREGMDSPEISADIIGELRKNYSSITEEAERLCLTFKKLLEKELSH
jgi:two-component system, sensor histidine kinase and response regulator